MVGSAQARYATCRLLYQKLSLRALTWAPLSSLIEFRYLRSDSCDDGPLARAQAVSRFAGSAEPIKLRKCLSAGLMTVRLKLRGDAV
jgi:hypothetical protein